MINRDLRNAPRFALPNGYRMRFYRDGDITTWLRIQAAAEKPSEPPGEDTFRDEYGWDHAYLAERIMFLVDPEDRDIGTITAWNDTEFEHRELGRIHWVAIVPEAQGVGLAKPMLSAACGVLGDHGHREAWLGTDSSRVPAVNLYLQFGFVPYPRDGIERDAWQTLAPQLRYPLEPGV